MADFFDWIDVKDATEFIDTQDVEFVDPLDAAGGGGIEEYYLESGAEAIACEDGGALLTESVGVATPAIDYIAFASFGVYSDTWGASNLNYLCNLYASWGMMEDAPNVTTNISEKMIYYLQQMEVIGA